MAEIVYYEVYVFKKGKWQLTSRYPREKKAAALEDAQDTETLDKVPTKIIKETYNTYTKKTTEDVIYISKRIKQEQPKETLDFSAEDASSSPKKANMKVGLLKLIAIVTLSAVLAFVLGLTATFLITNIYDVDYLDFEATKIFVIFFVIFFLLTSMPLGIFYIPWGEFDDDETNSKQNGLKKKKEKNNAEDVKEREAKPGLISEIFVKFLYKILDIEENKEKMENSVASENIKNFLDDEMKKQEEIENIKKGKEKNIEDQDKNNDKNQEEENNEYEGEEYEEEIKEQEENQEKENKKQELKAEEINYELNRHWLMRFLIQMISSIKEHVPNIDAFGRFGINLILAGACETLKYRKKISEENMRKILLESMELMGSKLSQAEYMLDKLDALSLEPRYMKMIQIGQEEMDNMIDNEGDMDFRQGALIFKQWNEIEKNDIKQAKEALSRTKKDIPSGIIAIMFTDIVNSALIQQDIGDAAAQIRVRTHNRIVRQAIRRYKGFEIKHTGDGIMSCFGSISKSVDAAVNIQRELYQFNIDSNTNIQIRIGINAGEPIIEDGDLFGSPVTIASRICSITGDSSICVSNLVRQLIIERKYPMKTLGFPELKGINEDIEVFEVDWDPQNQEIEEEFLAEESGNEEESEEDKKEAKKYKKKKEETSNEKNLKPQNKDIKSKKETGNSKKINSNLAK